MDFGNAYLFNKKPEDMRRVGALGGRARARNLQLRQAHPAPVTQKIGRPREETAGETIRRIDARSVNLFMRHVHNTGVVHRDVACIERDRPGYLAQTARGTAGRFPSPDEGARHGSTQCTR